jgi:hypothetical protein
MEWAALIAWILTALGGSAMFAIWVDKGGLRRGAEPGPRIRPPLIFAHLGIAGTGLVPPEQRFPPALVAVHGIAAVVTLVFVVDAI